MKKRWKAAAIIGSVLLATLILSGVVSAKSTSSKNPQQSLNKVKTIGKKAPQYAKDEILVKFKSGVTSEEMQKINTKNNTSVLRTNKKLGFHTLRIPKGKMVKEMVRIYNQDSHVEYAEPNYVVYALAIPNDPNFSYQWGLNNTGQTGGKLDADIDAPEAWDVETGDPSVIIAIIDTGVGLRHPDLVNKMWVNSDEIPDNGIDDDTNGYIDDYRGWNSMGEYRENFSDDDNGHGTWCAGIAAAETNNGVGGAGVCQKSKIMPVKVLDSGGSGYDSWIADGIVYATDNGAHVISMSLGGSMPSETLKSAMQYAYNAGVTIVCAAGNDYGLPVSYPAAYDQYCLGVAATDHNDKQADFSSAGPEVDVAAPGVDVYSAFRYNDEGTETHRYMYTFGSGTSASTPFVAGLAGLVISHNPTLTNNQVMNQIKYTADDINSAKYKGDDDYLGTGRINAYQALTTSPHPVIFYKSNIIVDATGNQNQRAEPGETVNMIITLGNLWANASGVTATLSTTDSYVNITAGSSNFGNIAADSTGNNSSNPYTFSVASSCPQGHKVTFTLNITAPGYSDTYNFDMIVAWPDILFVDDDGEKLLDAYYTDALDANGLTYDVRKIPFNWDGPTAAQMAPYKVVIWDALYVGRYIGPGVMEVGRSLTTQDAQSLSSYLNAGGNLFITSSNLMAPTPDPGVADFVRDYLHTSPNLPQSWTDYVAGVSGDLFDGINLNIPDGIAYNLVPDAQAKSIFTISDPACPEYGNPCALRYPAIGSSTYRVAFLGFNFHQVASKDGRKFVMSQIVNWLRQTTPPPRANLAPAADAGYSQSAFEGERVTLDGSVSADPDGTIKSYEWKEGGTRLSRSSSFTQRFGLGPHFITLTVTDNKGATDTDTVRVYVAPALSLNNGPNIPAAPSGPTSIEPGKLYSYTVSATDPEGDQIYYEFDWGDGPYIGTFQATELYNSGVPVSIPHAFPEGIFEVRVRAFDTYGDAYYPGGTLYHWSEPLTVISDAIPPSTITDLTATAGAYPDIKLTWSPATDNVGVDHYNIYRNTSATINKATHFLTTAAYYSTSCTDYTGEAGTTYYYAVCAVDKAGNEADLSNIASATVAGTVAFEDSFEVGEWNGLWTEDSQNKWFRSTQRAIDGSYSAEVDGPASDAKLISIPINLQGKTNANITYAWYIEKGLDAGEYLALDVSTDGGNTWVQKSRLEGDVPGYEDKWFWWWDIKLTNISQLQIRFRGTMSGSSEDANVDKIKVIAW